jgi:hypothetical protein
MDDDEDASATRSPECVMDRWLQRQLRIAYDDAADEPLPP